MFEVNVKYVIEEQMNVAWVWGSDHKCCCVGGWGGGVVQNITTDILGARGGGGMLLP